jgi:hypothetical protein
MVRAPAQLSGRQAEDRRPISRLQTANDSFNDKLAGNIGQDILNRFIVTVDCKHAVMYLEKTPLWNKPASFNRSGMLVDYNHDSDEIKTVFPDSPAEAAGLRQGDRILTIKWHQAIRRSERPTLQTARRHGPSPSGAARRDLRDIRRHAARCPLVVLKLHSVVFLSGANDLLHRTFHAACYRDLSVSAPSSRALESVSYTVAYLRPGLVGAWLSIRALKSMARDRELL